MAQDNPARLCVHRTSSVLKGSTRVQRAKASGEEPRVVGRSVACVTPGGALPFSGLQCSLQSVVSSPYWLCLVP